MAELTGSATRRPPLPARRLPGRRHRLGAGRAPGRVLAAAARDRARGDLRGSGPGRHVPALAVLPAAAVVDQAARPGAARLARVRALRLEQPARATTRRRGRCSPSSWTGPRTSRPGPRWRPTSPAFADRGRRGGPLRLPLDRDPRSTTARTDVGSWSRRPTASTARRSLIVAVGVAEPHTPPGPGMEHAHHYADVRPAEAYAGKRVFIIGKQNSGFELANGLLPWARQLVLASPSTARLSVDTRSLVGVRARYVQPYEDHVLGGGVAILDAAIDRIEPRARRRRALAVHVRRTDGGGDLVLEVGRGHLGDRLRVPAAGPAGARRHDVRGEPVARADALVGERDGARDLLRRDDRAGREGPPAPRPAEQLGRRPRGALQRPAARRRGSPTTQFGVAADRPRVAAADLVDLVVGELAEAPELWHQRGYLARVITADPDAGLVDDGVQPLTHVLDAGGPGRAGGHARGGRDAARSTRSCTRASAARSPSGCWIPTRSCATTDRTRGGSSRRSCGRSSRTPSPR